MTTRLRALACAGALLLAVLVGCSAIVGEIELDCTRDGCAALNQQENLGDEDCFIYQCRAGNKGCELRARDLDNDKFPDQATCGDAGLEVPLDCQDDAGERYPDAADQCNDFDDDCDSRIDEDALSSELAFSESSEVTLDGAVAYLSHSTLPDEPLDVVVGYKASNRVDWWRENDFTMLERECNEGLLNADCTFQEVAVASTERVLLAAGVNTNGCPSGQVRLGASIGAEFTWKLAASGAFALGIDSLVQQNRACSSHAGASRVSTALLSDSLGSYGLVLWRDAGLGVPESADLVGVGAWLSPEAPSGRPRVQTARGDNSEPISEQAGLDSAALAAWPALDQGGFFAAYDAGKEIELLFVPRPRTQASPLLLQRGGRLQGKAPRAVALALDATAETSAALALAVSWREESELGFAEIVFDPRADPVLRAQPTLTIPAAGPVLAGPTIVARSEGFRAPGVVPSGGWYVLWLEQQGSGKRLMAVRIQRAEVAPLGQPFVVALGEDIGHPFAFPGSKPNSIDFGFVSGGSDPTLHIGSLGCQ